MASTGESEGVRTFVAIELDVDLRTTLGELQGRLRRAPLARLGRWVAPEGIHLTLKFLGNVPAGRVPELGEALRRACARIAPFEIAIAGLGCFPSYQRPRVLWVGVEEPTGSLERLYSAVERELERVGFRPEGRPFTPHLTLARVSDHAAHRERA
ncbi:MAG: RNA 2',3'-cyclic phosphodiesterase, partial [Anaerolineae bacterium]|nr:RNA 2',3'-cyclic phosphodiesterase [Anaerolineae bacterium]